MLLNAYLLRLETSPCYHCGLCGPLTPPPLSPASGPPGKKQPDNQLCRTTARRWAAARGGQGGQKVQEFIPGKRGPVLVKVSLHSFAVIVHGGGEGGILAGRNAAMQNTNHRDGSIAGAAICLNQLGWSGSNWVTVGFLLSAEKYLGNIRVVKISLLPNKPLMISFHSN